MFDWVTDLYNWIVSLPSRGLDLILRPAADYIDTIAPISNTPADFFSGLPIDILQLSTLIGIPEGLAIIAVAYPIRLLLQLIPFVRLGS